MTTGLWCTAHVHRNPLARAHIQGALAKGKFGSTMSSTRSCLAADSCLLCFFRFAPLHHFQPGLKSMTVLILQACKLKVMQREVGH